MKKLLLFAAITFLVFGCERKSIKTDPRADGKTDGDISVETYINAKAKRNYALMWKCLTPRIQQQCGSFEDFKAEQEETYKLLGDSGWKALTDQMREDAAKIRAVKIDGKCYVDEK